MKSRYINEKTAYMYALHEWDNNTYTRRQNSLISLNLSSKKEQVYEKMFQLFKKKSSMKANDLDKRKRNNRAFWIYAYAKQSALFHQKKQQFIFEYCFFEQSNKEIFLISLFLQCYSVFELNYPKVFIVA